MINIEVNEKKCQDCGVCLTECIHKKKKRNTNHVDHNYIFCNQCLHCYAICPNKAIEVGGYSNSKEITNSRINYDDLLYLLQKRRSVRYFKDKCVEEDVLNNILNSTKYIPSGGNNQNISITILKNQEKKELLKNEIVQYYRKINKISQNKVIRFFSTFFGSEKIKEGFRNKCFVEKINDMNEKLMSIDLVFYNAPLVIVLHSRRILPTAKEDVILAAYNIVLSAESLGLGSCFVSLSQQAINNKKRCKEIIKIDQNNKIHAVVVLGYPVRKYKRTVYRENKNINIID